MPTSDIVKAVPWQGDESLTYRVVDERGRPIGKETLSIDVNGRTTTLTQLFEGVDRRDESVAVVDTGTLKPVSSTRTIETPDDDELIEVTYNEQGALIKTGDKQSGLSVPEHAYDNDTSLFLWRTIDFTPGYDAAYITVITNFRTRQTVRVHVTGRETVKVPAGDIQAWRVEIKTSNANQVAWYADTPSRPLVRYNNDRNVIFEIETLPSASR